MNENILPNKPVKTRFLSFGYRCSSAGILKQLEIKTESHPFDWIVSRLPIIQHCLETDFKYYIQDISNTYCLQQTQTVHYEISSNDPLLICDETVYYNTYYAEYKLSPYHTTQPLSMPKDTYSYPLLMNHHKMMDPEVQSYFHRCIGRLERLLSSPKQKMYLYIHPALSVKEWNTHRSGLMDELLAFQQFLHDRYPQTYPRGLLFLPIKTEHPYPITDYYPTVLEEVHNTLSATDGNPQCSIYLVYMNRDFIDAGEVFMRNAYIETEAIISKIREYL